MPYIGNYYYPPNVRRPHIKNLKLRQELATLLWNERGFQRRCLEIASNKTSMQGYSVGHIEGLEQALEHHQMVIDLEKAKARNAHRARKIYRLANISG